MMVVMTPQATPADIEAVVKRLEAAGVHAKVMPGELTTAIGAIGDPEGVREAGFEGMEGVDRVANLDLEGEPGVDHVVPITKPYKLASAQFRKGERSVVEVGGRRIGGPYFATIAGPCTVESREVMLDAARSVRDGGAQLLRGGAYKPRTSPYSFQGLGEEGLRLLACLLYTSPSPRDRS